MSVEALDGWEARAQGWLDRDHALLVGDEGWRTLAAPDGIGLWSRPMPDDPNLLFRWRLPQLAAPPGAVYDAFVTRILELHHEWTREFVGGRVLSEPAPGVRVLHQRFDPGIPGITRRDLCSVEVTRTLPGGAWLVSYRSVDALPSEPGHVRIDWWGAALCRPQGEGSELLYLDRENQGGWFPAWAMNAMMPKYLILQAREVERWFREAAAESRRVADPAPR